jgi:exodeoxyribonuclease VII small subunit
MKKLDYASAQTELQKLLQELQDEKTDLDQLAEKVARARELIQFCRERLRLAEVEVNKLLEN